MTRPTTSAPDEPAKTGHWAAFGYQNHVIPTEDPRREGPNLIALCGVMTAPEEINPRDERPTCAVCAEEVRSGRFAVLPVTFD